MAPLQRLFAGIFLCLAASGYAQYDGIVGSEGCQAISHTDPRIMGWATGCVVERGYYDIANDRRRVSYGTDADGIGPTQASTTSHVVSLGDSGVATLTFAQPISDGEGYDFVVFENSLNNTFLELAFVEVSSDGVNFVRFPAVSKTSATTQVPEIGPVDATKLYNLAGKYRLGWGTPFDLYELKDSGGIDIYNITHVRLVDVVGTIDSAYASYDSEGNIINDPYPTPYYSSGFDLSGVAVLNHSVAVREPAATMLSIGPNPADEALNVDFRHDESSGFCLCDVTGRPLLRGTLNPGRQSIPLREFPAGIYFLTFETQQGINTIKVVVKH